MTNPTSNQTTETIAADFREVLRNNPPSTYQSILNFFRNLNSPETEAPALPKVTVITNPHPIENRVFFEKYIRASANNSPMMLAYAGANFILNFLLNLIMENEVNRYLNKYTVEEVTLMRKLYEKIPEDVVLNMHKIVGRTNINPPDWNENQIREAILALKRLGGSAIEEDESLLFTSDEEVIRFVELNQEAIESTPEEHRTAVHQFLLNQLESLSTS